MYGKFVLFYFMNPETTLPLYQTRAVSSIAGDSPRSEQGDGMTEKAFTGDKVISLLIGNIG